MRVRRIKQHISEFFRRDWLEGSLTVFGVVVFAVGVACLLIVIYLVATYNNYKFFSQVGPSFSKGLSVVGIVIFGCLAGVSLIGSWGLVGKRIAKAVTGRRHRE
jgi:hypothetical protein